MRVSRFATHALLALCAWGANLPATAQEWQLEQRATENKGTIFNVERLGQRGIDRRIRVSESSPGAFTVIERTPFTARDGGNACVQRPRPARLVAVGSRQVLTIAPVFGGCPQTRLVFEADGSGWEEEDNAGRWVKTGAYLLGNQKVASSQPVSPAPEPAVASAPAAAPVPAAQGPALSVAAAPPALAEEPRRESPALAKNGHRRALLIGNDNYRSVSKLLNARSDARAMALSLERAGFEVTTRLDVDGRTMRAALRDFKASVEGGDEVVVFYSGHGIQIGGVNYLLPVDIQGDSEDQIRDDGIALQRVLDDVGDKRARFMLAVIDACRDNPFKGSGRAIGGTRGLAPTTAATGQMIIYSAGSGQRALDRLSSADKDPNGLFTRVFLKQMEVPGLPIDRVLRNVRNDVVRMARAVGHDQTPALYDQTVGDFYLRPTH